MMVAPATIPQDRGEAQKMALSLKEFVSEALTEVVLGVESAREKLAALSSCAVVAPAVVSSNGGTNYIKCYTGSYTKKDERLIEWAQVVEFDVAVHATENKVGSGGVQVAALNLIKANLGGKQKTEEGSVSRIKFNVPLILNMKPEKKSESSIAKKMAR